MKFVFPCLLSLVVVSLLQASTEACSCLPPRVDRSYFHAKKVIIGKVLKVYNCPPGKKGSCPTSGPDAKRYYKIKVLKSYKGCLKKKKKIVINTPRSGAACGVFLDKGKKYLLNIQKHYGVFLCDYNVKKSELKPSDKKFLKKQVQCCKKGGRPICKCNDGSRPVNCLVDPCSVSKPPCQEAKVCKSNYCGGCNAFWFKKGGKELACLPK